MLRPLGPSQKESLERATTLYQQNVEWAEGYLESRGIDRELADRFRLGVVAEPLPGHERLAGRLAIPSLGRSDSVYALRFRALDGSEPKYLGLPGVDLRLFNVRGLHLADDSIHITEGELDAISLGACGLHAVALPGVKSWKPHHPRLFAGFSRVYIWGDGDTAGRDFAEKLGREIDTSIIVHVPDGMDCNSLLVQEGKDALLSMCV